MHIYPATISNNHYSYHYYYYYYSYPDPYNLVNTEGFNCITVHAQLNQIHLIVQVNQSSPQSNFTSHEVYSIVLKYFTKEKPSLPSRCFIAMKWTHTEWEHSLKTCDFSVIFTHHIWMPAILKLTLFSCGTRLIVNSLVELCQLPGSAWAFKYRMLPPPSLEHVRPSVLCFTSGQQSHIII